MSPLDLDEMFTAHDVAVAYLFGSRADGTATAASDHDVAVLFAASQPPLIVHLHAEVDDERLARAVRDGGLDDLSAFATRIAALAVR